MEVRTSCVDSLFSKSSLFLCPFMLLLSYKYILRTYHHTYIIYSIQISHSIVISAIARFFIQRKILFRPNFKEYCSYFFVYIVINTTTISSIKGLQLSFETLVVSLLCVPFGVTFLRFFFVDHKFPSEFTLFSLNLALIGLFGYLQYDRHFQLRGSSEYLWIVLFYSSTCLLIVLGWRKNFFNQELLLLHVYYNNVVSTLFFVLFMVTTGEFEELIRKVGTIKRNIFHKDLIIALLLSLYGRVGTELLIFYYRKFLSAAAYIIIEPLSIGVAVALNWLIFNERQTHGSLFWLVVCIGGHILYTAVYKDKAAVHTK